MAESRFSMGQSREIYRRDRPEYGVKAGDRELSFCIFQIHSPAHDANAKRLGLGDYRTNIESCVKMARHIYTAKGDFSDWTVFTKKTYLAYVR